MVDGYWQTNISEKNHHRTSFNCHSGTCQYICMLIGLKNAPATFNRAPDLILTRYKWKRCLEHMHGIIIFSVDVEKHIHQMDEILTTIEGLKTTVKIKKCGFFSDLVN